MRPLSEQYEDAVKSKTEKKFWGYIEYSLVKRQIEPQNMQKITDFLEVVIKYYNDLQTEAPDNLSLGRFHTNMVILIEQFEEYKSNFSATS